MAEAKDLSGDDEPATSAPSGRARGGWLARFAPGVRNLVAKRDPEHVPASTTVPA